MLDSAAIHLSLVESDAFEAGDANHSLARKPDRDPDLALVARARLGDRNAIGELYRRHHKRLLQVALRHLRDAAESEDIVQDAFIKVSQNIHAFKSNCTFSTWTHRIVQNLAFDATRRRARMRQIAAVDVETEDARADDHPGPDAAFINREIGNELERASSALPDSHRNILALREIEGLSYDELAVKLRVPKGTVMSRLFHARKKMQRALEPFMQAC